MIVNSLEADKRHSEFDIKPLLRGINKEDPQRVFFSHQAPEGNIQKIIEAYGEFMATYRVDLTTMQ